MAFARATIRERDFSGLHARRFRSRSSQKFSTGHAVRLVAHGYALRVGFHKRIPKWWWFLTLKADYTPLETGCAVAVASIVIWHFANSGYIPLTSSGMATLLPITLLLCPSSLMAVRVNPDAPWTIDVAILYLTIIFLNGLFYAGIGAILGGIPKKSRPRLNEKWHPR